MLTPCITSSLALPFNGVETACVRALEGWLAVLRSELATVGGSIVHIKVGNVDPAAPGSTTGPAARATLARLRQQQLRLESREMAEWSDAAREAYAQR